MLVIFGVKFLPFFCFCTYCISFTFFLTTNKKIPVTSPPVVFESRVPSSHNEMSKPPFVQSLKGSVAIHPERGLGLHGAREGHNPRFGTQGLLPLPFLHCHHLLFETPYFPFGAVIPNNTPTPLTAEPEKMRGNIGAGLLAGCTVRDTRRKQVA